MASEDLVFLGECLRYGGSYIDLMPPEVVDDVYRMSDAPDFDPALIDAQAFDFEWMIADSSTTARKRMVAVCKAIVNKEVH